MGTSSPRSWGCEHSLTHAFFTALTDLILQCHLDGCVRDSKYIYLSHLMVLDTCKPAPGEYTLKDSLPWHSLLRVEAWSQELARHPYRYYVT